MDLILCHTTADFDALGAAVGLTRSQPGAKIVLTGGCHPTVRDFLALHRDEYGLIERRSVEPKQIRCLMVVDTQQRDRLGKAADWFDLANVTEIVVYDHHPYATRDIPATRSQIESVGATTTLIVEQLQKLASQSAETTDSQFLTPAEATVMALGIHVDTGSLTYDGATPRDASALAWLMAQGASLSVIAQYVDPGLSPRLQHYLKVALEHQQKSTANGYTICWVLLETPGYIPGLSSLAARLIEITESDALLLASTCLVHEEVSSPLLPSESNMRLTVIGRSQIPGVDLNRLFQPLSGGGHAGAAALTMRCANPKEILEQLVVELARQIQPSPTARELMSSPVRTIRPETTIAEAQRILLRYGHSGLSVVNAQDELVGIISRRDLDIATRHGFGHAPVKGYMSANLKTISPDTPLSEIESLMVTYDIGRLPVLEDGALVGIVTRTDVLRQLHQLNRGMEKQTTDIQEHLSYCPLPISQLRSKLAPQLWTVLSAAADRAEKRGWHLYLVGGAVRDLLLADRNSNAVNLALSINKDKDKENSHSTAKTIWLQDIDLVVDGFHSAADAGAGVELARSLQQLYPDARLEIHGAFQTAALLWHKHPQLDSLWIDIATARTEFYPYPAANPEVEASSIRQDLYRRDFTINALALRLTSPNPGELLDFFGGCLDLAAKKIRVLHPNSFIEDPTRIYRAVRFAVRLGFQIEPQTEGYIRHAIASGIYTQVQQVQTRVPALETRLKAELKYILQAPYWKQALQLLADLDALRCIHPSLELNHQLWWQVRLVDRCLHRFDPQKTLEHWQMRLEVLIAALKPPYPAQVAATLQLPADSIERLQQLNDAQSAIVQSLPASNRTSQIVRLLNQYKLPTLILVAARSPRSIRRQIWQYLTELRHIKAPLNGNDLKQLGYKPGRQFKQILDQLLAATLDGEICDRHDALFYLSQNYPQLDA
jgi:tRNA nucleotidyltransferase (CCA-adding enzyme)